MYLIIESQDYDSEPYESLIFGYAKTQKEALEFKRLNEHKWKREILIIPIYEINKL